MRQSIQNVTTELTHGEKQDDEWLCKIKNVINFEKKIQTVQLLQEYKQKNNNNNAKQEKSFSFFCLKKVHKDL